MGISICAALSQAIMMADVSQPANTSPDSDLATQVARLWPHRAHEANILLGQLCRVGLHRWRQLDLAELVPGKDIHFCFWCDKVKIGGLTYTP